MDPRTQGAEIRALVGYAPEHDTLPPDVAAYEIVAHLAEMRGLPRREAAGRASDVLFELGLGEERLRPVGTMSTGQRQRVKLAQAIAADPDARAARRADQRARSDAARGDAAPRAPRRRRARHPRVVVVAPARRGRTRRRRRGDPRHGRTVASGTVGDLQTGDRTRRGAGDARRREPEAHHRAQAAKVPFEDLGDGRLLVTVRRPTRPTTSCATRSRRAARRCAAWNAAARPSKTSSSPPGDARRAPGGPHRERRPHHRQRLPPLRRAAPRRRRTRPSRCGSTRCAASSASVARRVGRCCRSWRSPSRTCPTSSSWV